MVLPRPTSSAAEAGVAHVARGRDGIDGDRLRAVIRRQAAAARP
jgi:hypothetical protein